MSAAPPQMRRIPDEQFFDLRSWNANVEFTGSHP